MTKQTVLNPNDKGKPVRQLSMELLTARIHYKSVTDDEIVELEALSAAGTTGEWIVATGEDADKNWHIASLGNSSVDGQDYYVTTNNVRASEVSGDSKTDAELIVRLRNVMPRLIHEWREMKTRLAGGA